MNNTNNSYILFAAHDHGGANVIKPIYEYYFKNGFYCIPFFIGPAAKYIQVKKKKTLKL